jgi:magnesium-transporting ATPase (P-type)
LSIFFYLFCIATYQLVGRRGASQFSNYTLTANHVLGTRALSWMLILFVPIIGITVDVVGKVFSNMFYPTQTQIHLEREAFGKMMARRRGRPSSENARRRIQRAEEP